MIRFDQNTINLSDYNKNILFKGTCYNLLKIQYYINNIYWYLLCIIREDKLGKLVEQQFNYIIYKSFNYTNLH